jgi:cytochrome c biogenesis protein CcmG/thiol:disulfide interchange protein DsbE
MSESPRSRPVAPYIAGAVGTLLVLFLVVLALAKPGKTDSASSPLLGEPAPVVKSTTTNNETFDLARRKGSWVVLNFFNSTCVPCRQEQISSDEPVELYTVVNDDSDGAVKAFFQTNGGDWPVVRDDDGAIAVAFGIAKVPESWVIDPNGFVRLRILGALTEGFLTQRLTELKTQFAGGA